MLRLEGYSSARSEMSQMQEGMTWLDANENPYEPFPGKPETVSYNRYPDPQPQNLIKLFSALYHVPADSLLVTRGSDEGIDILMRMFCRDGKDAIMTCVPTYGYYKVAAAIQGAKVVEVSLDKRFQLDVPAVLKARKPNIKLVILCSPNNPTGNLLDKKSILKICQKLKGKAVVVVDEAYLEFAKVVSMAEFVSENSNLVVLRTLSKAHALAGVRCGVTIASPKIIEIAKRVIAPYPIPVPTIRAVLRALSPDGMELMQSHARILIAERERMRKILEKHKDVKKIYPSDTNFLLMETKNAQAFLETCRAKGVVLRNRSGDVPNSVRLTIGTPVQNNKVLEILGLRQKEVFKPSRRAEVTRNTRETRIHAILDLDDASEIAIQTGVEFFDHMLEQLAKHGGFGLLLACKGDTGVDAHHTIEDCALVIGQALQRALGDKKGIGRYGFLLPMDESLAQVAMDLSGRPVFKFDGKFSDQLLGQFPTEMTPHFFKSLADGLGASLHIKVEGENTHHMVEACFKGVGRALRMACKREGTDLPSTKGVL